MLLCAGSGACSGYIAAVSSELSNPRILSALIFDRLCNLSGLTVADLCRYLQKELGRTHEMQPATLRSWRNGQAPVPFEATLVLADRTRMRFPGLELLLLGEPIDDEDRRRKALSRLVEQTRSRST